MADESKENGNGGMRDAFKNIRRLEIKSRKLVENVFSGEYHSAFKGAGIEFSEVRPYQEGDDVRSIDWNVTARAGRPFIKLFHEEREQTVILMLDASASGSFGTRSRMKSEVSAEICATLAFSAIKNGDKVGLLIFTDRVELFIPPAKGRTHVLRIIREALYFKPQGTGTDLATAMERLNSTVKRRAIVFLLSDFEANGYEKPFRVAAKRHDLIAIEVFDPAERILPDAGLINLLDAETGEEFLIDSSNPDFRRTYHRKVEAKEKERERFFGKSGADHVQVACDKPSVDPLIAFFKKRERRMALRR